MLKLQFKDRRQEAVWLVDPGITIGRDKVSGLVLDEDGVAGFHADLRVSGEDVTIEAVGTDSATFVNGEQISEPTTLGPGDLVRIGKVELLVVDPKDMTAQDPSDAPAAPVAEPETPTAARPVEQVESDWALRAETGPLAGKLFPVLGEQVLGRALQCDISIPEARLSREHARLSIEQGELVVRDLESSNGTFHNGERIAEARLRHGDALAFDTLRFKVIGPANNLDRTVISMAPAQVAGAAPEAAAAADEADTEGSRGIPAWVWVVGLLVVAGGAAVALL